MADFAAIFDVDGVLVDSVGLNWQANNAVLAAYGIHVDESQLARYVGRTLTDQISMLNSEHGLSIDPVAFAALVGPKKKALFANIGPKPGAVALLHALQAAGVPLAYATSLPKSMAEPRLRSAGVLEYFSVRVMEEDVSAHKPSPEVYLRAARELGAAPERCLVFEDAPSGIAAALAAGMKCMAVSTSYVPRAELAGAHLIVGSLEEVDLATLRALFTAG